MTDIEIQETEQRIATMIAEAAKLQAETAQYKMSTFLAPFLAGAAVFGAAAAFIRLFFSG